jgi:hypothetical protein
MNELHKIFNINLLHAKFKTSRVVKNESIFYMSTTYIYAIYIIIYNICICNMP